MSITPTALTRLSAIAAIAAGVLFIGIQLHHPHSDVSAVTLTEWAVRNCLKMVMAALALAGITGMYLRQVKEIRLLGLIGYLVFATGYLTILSIAFVSAVVFPAIAGTAPGYVDDVLSAATTGGARGDIGLIQGALSFSGITFLLGGLLFGIALFRARVLARWACVLLAVASLLTISLAFLPDSAFRLLAVPNSIAMISLGYSLWQRATPETTTAPNAVAANPLEVSGA